MNIEEIKTRAKKADDIVDGFFADMDKIIQKQNQIIDTVIKRTDDRKIRNIKEEIKNI